jgi:hypothetical protein
MRKTVTLDAVVVALIREAVHRTRRPFKRVINDAVRAGLTAQPGAREVVSFEVAARPLGLRSEIDPRGLGKLADDLEVETFLAPHHQQEDHVGRPDRGGDVALGRFAGLRWENPLRA